MQAAADDDLIAATRRGDRDAFAIIIERYQRAVAAVAYAGLRDRARADDVTQDTFVIAWRRIGELRDGTRLAAWLCGIARNLARDARRRHHRDHDLDVSLAVGSLEPGSSYGTTPFEALSDAETETIIAAALGQVPDVYREPLVLYYYEERSIDDVARSLGISAATTTKRLSRGRRYLADRVATVERGLARYLPRPGLAAGVLAVIGIAGTASHVEASTSSNQVRAESSTMHKLSVAAILTATVGGGAIVIGVTTLRSDAHAGATAPAPLTRDLFAPLGPISSTRPPAQKSAHAELHDCMRSAAFKLPSLIGVEIVDSTDCAAVGRHLADLQDDVTHGATGRADEAAHATCAGDYESKCEAEGWSDTQRTCVLGSGDLLNAHLCAAGVVMAATDRKPTEIPPQLACSVIGPHIAQIMQAAGHHLDITDLDKQIEAACDLGTWTIEIRGCLGGAKSVDDLKTCITARE